MSDDLGDLVATHRYGDGDARRALRGGLGVVVLGVVIVFLGHPLGYLLAGGGAVFLVVAEIGLAITRARHGGGTIDRHEEGLHIALRNRAPIRVRFDDLGPIHAEKGWWEMLERKPTATAAISPWFALTAARVPKNVWTHRFHVGDFVVTVDRRWSEVTELVAALVAARRRVRLPLDKRAIDSGESVAFGPIELSSAGVRISSRTLEWPAVVDVTTQQAQVVVRRKSGGRFAAIDTREIPDVDVLLALAKWIPTRRDSYR